MHPNAPLAHLQQHRPAVAAVMREMRDKTGSPDASESALIAARDAGLIRIEKSTGAGIWRMTPLGADLMTDY